MTSILEKDQARQKLLAGVSKLADHVVTTLGPKGRHIIIEQPMNGEPLVTKDGVTVAKSISSYGHEIEDPIENMGARLVTQAAAKTVDMAGDGTTLTCLLCSIIVKEAHRLIQAGSNPSGIKKGIDMACEVTVKALKEMAIPCELSDLDKLIAVATISANGDEVLGKLVATALQSVGEDGICTVEESKGTETNVEIVTGMKFDRGYLSPYFVTDVERMECVYEDPYILLVDRKISTMSDLLPIWEKVNKQGRPFVIIAEGIDGPALNAMTVNRIRSHMPIVAVKAPGFATRMKENLGDIAALTGGIVISTDAGMNLQNASVSMLGTAKKVVISEDYTTIIEGAGAEDEIEKRRKEVRGEIERSTDYNKEKAQERLARLSSGVAVVRIGGRTEVEMKEARDRTEDALLATKAAVMEGIVPGGGMALYRLAQQIKNSVCAKDDWTHGTHIVYRALLEPFRQIVRNAGLDPSEVAADLPKDESFGYDAANDQYSTMVDFGIIDPAKVVRCALENAVSVAGQIILCEGTVSIKREPLNILNPNPDEI